MLLMVRAVSRSTTTKGNSGTARGPVIWSNRRASARYAAITIPIRSIAKRLRPLMCRASQTATCRGAAGQDRAHWHATAPRRSRDRALAIVWRVGGRSIESLVVFECPGASGRLSVVPPGIVAVLDASSAAAAAPRLSQPTRTTTLGQHWHRGEYLRPPIRVDLVATLLHPRTIWATRSAAAACLLVHGARPAARVAL